MSGLMSGVKGSQLRVRIRSNKKDQVMPEPTHTKSAGLNTVVLLYIHTVRPFTYLRMYTHRNVVCMWTCRTPHYTHVGTHVDWLCTCLFSTTQTLLEDESDLVHPAVKHISIVQTHATTVSTSLTVKVQLISPLFYASPTNCVCTYVHL